MNTTEQQQIGTEKGRGVVENLASEIRVEHAAAQQHAEQAIEHAKRAGQLLMQVKAELPHGEFLPWIDANLEVSRRQAQRYIRAAQGKPMTARQLKNDTVSHLPADCEDGSNWLPDDERTGLMLELEPYRGREWTGEGYESAWVQPVLHVQLCPNDGPHYDVMLLNEDRISYTKKPIAHWALLYNLVTMAAGRRLKDGSYFPIFDPLENEDSTAKGHSRMQALPWQTYIGRGFVRSLINIKLQADGAMPWPMGVAA